MFTIPPSSSMVMKIALPLPGRWRISTTPAVRTIDPFFAAATSPALSTPSRAKAGRRKAIGWPFSDRRVV
jgi:hypothetical protein